MHIIRNLVLLLFVCLLGIAGCGYRDPEALKNELAYRQLGINKMEEGEYEEAVKAFQNALDLSIAQIDELEIDICYYKAAAQYRAGDTEEAIKTYTALVEYDGKNADAFYLRGTLYLISGDTQAAVKDYQEAAKQAGNDGKLYNHMAENLNGMGLSEEADIILQQALELPGENAEDYRDKGYAYFLLGQYDNARTYLDKAINMQDTEAVFYLAKVLDARGDTEQAARLYETYIGEYSDDTVTLNALGRARMQEGNYSQALMFFQSALEVEEPVNEQELRRNEIIALEYQLEFEKAREKMASYITDYPEDEAALREYEFLQTR